MSNQDRWRNEDRAYRDDDRSPRDGRSQDDQRYRSQGGSGENGRFGSGRGVDSDDYGRGSIRGRSDYDHGGSNFNRGDRSGESYRSGQPYDDRQGGSFGAYAEDYERGQGGYGGGYDRDYGSGGQDYGRGYAGNAFGDRSRNNAGRGFGGGRNDSGAGRSFRQSYGVGAYGGSSGSYGSSDFNRGRDQDDRGRGFWDRASDEVSSWFGDEGAERRRQQDQFQGRGPKGYNRSGDRIREDVSDRLSDEPSVDASEIEVSVTGNEVTLSGTVQSRDQRRRAEDVAERVSGVSYVQNNLRVQSQTSYGSATYGGIGSASGNSGPSRTAGSSQPGGSIGHTAFGRDTSTGASTASETASGASSDATRTKGTST